MQNPQETNVTDFRHGSKEEFFSAEELMIERCPVLIVEAEI